MCGDVHAWLLPSTLASGIETKPQLHCHRCASMHDDFLNCDFLCVIGSHAKELLLEILWSQHLLNLELCCAVKEATNALAFLFYASPTLHAGGPSLVGRSSVATVKAAGVQALDFGKTHAAGFETESIRVRLRHPRHSSASTRSRRDIITALCGNIV